LMFPLWKWGLGYLVKVEACIFLYHLVPNIVAGTCTHLLEREWLLSSLGSCNSPL
jgi:hypothetical protein